jgi:hypothetical protein
MTDEQPLWAYGVDPWDNYHHDKTTVRRTAPSGSPTIQAATMRLSSGIA